MRFAMMLAAVAALWVQPAEAVVVMDYEGTGTAYFNAGPVDPPPEPVAILFRAQQIFDYRKLIQQSWQATLLDGTRLAGGFASDGYDLTRYFWIEDNKQFYFLGRGGPPGAYLGWQGEGIITSVRANGAVVPEPATWALLLLGFAVIGGALRRRHRDARIVYSHAISA